MFEMRLILARLVWAFEMEAVQGRILDWRTLKSFSIIQKQPVMVRSKARGKIDRRASGDSNLSFSIRR